jgi:hypothetical protein
MEPIRAFHGSNSAPFDAIDFTKCGSGVVGSRWRHMFFLTSEVDNADFYTDNNGHISEWEITPRRTQVIDDRTPHEVLSEGWPLELDAEGNPKYDENDELCSPDCLIFTNVIDGACPSTVYVINDPEIARLVRVVQQWRDGEPVCVTQVAACAP